MSIVEVVSVVIAGWLILSIILALVLGRAIQLREKYEAPTFGTRGNTHAAEQRGTDASGINPDNLVFVGASEQK